MTPALVLALFQRDGAGFIGRLAGVGVELVKGQLVYRRVVHRQKNTAALNRRGEECRGDHLAAWGTKGDEVVWLDAERPGIFRMDFNVAIDRVQLAQYIRVSSA